MTDETTDETMSEATNDSEEYEAGVEHETNIRLPRFAFEEYLDALNGLVDEAAIRVTEDGLQSRAVDPANVAMVRVELSNSVFSDSDAGEAAFGINTARVEQIVGGIDNAFLDLEYDDEYRRLGLCSGPYRYTHSTIEVDSLRNEPDIPELDLSFKAEMDIGQLREAVEWFHEFTTDVRIGYDPTEQKLWMEADERRSGGEMGTDDGVFELGRGELNHVHECGNAESQFSVDYFKDIVQAVPEDRNVTIILGEDYPMKLSYKIGWEGTGPNEGFAHGEVEFMQAPRIQSD